MLRARREPERGATDTAPSSSFILISLWTAIESSPFGPLAVSVPLARRALTPSGTGIGRLARRDMVQLTMQSTSPPCPAARDSRSLITPLEVEITATPRPPITRGRSSARR